MKAVTNHADVPEDLTFLMGAGESCASAWQRLKACGTTESASQRSMGNSPMRWVTKNNITLTEDFKQWLRDGAANGRIKK